MITPTPPQAKVLAAIQQHSVAIAACMTEAAQLQKRHGQRPPSSWYDTFHHHATRREASADAANAAGIPSEWIAHVRERGERGVRWNPDLYLRAPGPVDWDRVLGGLDADVRRLREWTALSAAHQRFGARTDSGGLGEDLDRNVRILYARTVGVSNLLGLTEEQGQQLWGGAQDWVAAAVEPLTDATSERLAQRSRQVTRASLAAYTEQVAALVGAGISTTRAAALPALDDLTPRIAAVLPQPQPSLFLAPGVGTDIDNAVGVANLTYDAAPMSDSSVGTPLFSDPPDIEPWSGNLEFDNRPPAPPIWQGIER
ncbi:Uncharacterised protein [Nocardia farcinica]|uniref:hypothetical protein n=1 Tax=Nocardia farcinica TaxID=37329 RepID=UPI000E061814|nr:hypothetical protein [Nocardia farcinica]SUE28935.1 Uncharacterised protein [Nocardia farcinica]